MVEVYKGEWWGEKYYEGWEGGIHMKGSKNKEENGGQV